MNDLHDDEDDWYSFEELPGPENRYRPAYPITVHLDGTQILPDSGLFPRICARKSSATSAHDAAILEGRASYPG